MQALPGVVGAVLADGLWAARALSCGGPRGCQRLWPFRVIAAATGCQWPWPSSVRGLETGTQSKASNRPGLRPAPTAGGVSQAPRMSPELPEMPAVDDWDAALRFNVTLGPAEWRVELGETSVGPYKFSTPGYVVRNGSRVGPLQRGLEVKGQTGLTAVHDKLYLDLAAQRKGFGSAYLAHLLEQYAGLDVAAVKIVASDAGRLAWASPKLGVAFSRDEMPRQLLTTYQVDGVQRFRADCLKHGMSPQKADAFIAQVQDHPESWTPADLKCTPEGRLLLTDSVTWDGIIRLK